MKRIIISLLWLISATVNATIYYVAVDGDDDNPGTITEPWATWRKGFETVDAGDTLYIRGGVYYPTDVKYGTAEVIHINPYDETPVGHDGTVDNPVCIFAYPGETPILDCINVEVPNLYLTGISIERASFWHIKGLTIRHVLQSKESTIYGFITTSCPNLTVENLNVTGIGGKGIVAYSAFKHSDYPEQQDDVYDTTRYINCDASYCIDSIGRTPENTDFGNWSDGFWLNIQNPISYVEISGCRAWMIAEDGYDLPTTGVIHIHDSWSFNTGGGGIRNDPAANDTLPWIMNNNIAAYSGGVGMQVGTGSKANQALYFFNNICFSNQWGMWINGTLGEPRKEFYYNNILFNNRTFDVIVYDTSVTHSNNYWGTKIELLGREFTIPDHSPAVTANASDFLTVDSATIVSEMTASRKSDWSLPDITAFHLVEGSDLIDAGVQLPDSLGYTLSFYGDAPDMGVFEYGSPDSSANNILTFILTAQTGAATIDTANHTVSIEVEYGTSVTSLSPTITVSEGATISPTSGTATNFTSPVVYTVTALDTSTQEWTVTVTVEEAPEVPMGRIGQGTDRRVNQGSAIRVIL